MAFTSIGVWAQTIIKFQYDVNGNRISRSIEIQEIENKGISFPIKDTDKELKPIREVALVEDSGIKVYPNPTYGKFTIEIESLPDNQGIDYYIFDINGKVIEKSSVRSMIYEVDITSQPKGIYILRIISGKSFYAWKIIKY